MHSLFLQNGTKIEHINFFLLLSDGKMVFLISGMGIEFYFLCLSLYTSCDLR